MTGIFHVPLLWKHRVPHGAGGGCRLTPDLGQSWRSAGSWWEILRVKPLVCLCTIQSSGYFVSLFKTKRFIVSIITEEYAFINKAHLHTLGKILFQICLCHLYALKIISIEIQHVVNQLTACHRSFMPFQIVYVCAHESVLLLWLGIYVCEVAVAAVDGYMYVCMHARAYVGV